MTNQNLSFAGLTFSRGLPLVRSSSFRTSGCWESSSTVLGINFISFDVRCWTSGGDFFPGVIPSEARNLAITRRALKHVNRSYFARSFAALRMTSYCDALCGQPYSPRTLLCPSLCQARISIGLTNSRAVTIQRS